MRIRISDDYGRQQGFGKFLYILSYPVRKPLVTLFIIALLVLIPIFALKVAPKDIFSWYKDKVSGGYEYVAGQAEKQVSSIMPVISQPQQPALKIDMDLSAKSSKASKRKGFERAKTPVQGVDILATQNNADVVTPTIEGAVKTVVVNTDKPEVQKTIEVKKTMPLKYLDNQEEIEGNAKIINANAVEINETYVFLYGIYANPMSADGIAAENLLKKDFEGRNVRCIIVAYTHQDVATGICYYGEININQTLIEQGHSKNVAL